MADYNKVILVGRLTRDLELRYTPGGKAVVDVPLAINDGWGDKKTTIYIDCVFWERRAETLSQHLKKGSPLLVEGKLQLERWEQNGETKTKMKVRGWDFSFLPEGEKQQQAHTPPSTPQTQQQGTGRMGVGPNDIPF